MEGLEKGKKKSNYLDNIKKFLTFALSINKKLELEFHNY